MVLWSAVALLAFLIQWYPSWLIPQSLHLYVLFSWTRLMRHFSYDTGYSMFPKIEREFFFVNSLALHRRFYSSKTLVWSSWMMFLHIFIRRFFLKSHPSIQTASVLLENVSRSIFSWRIWFSNFPFNTPRWFSARKKVSKQCSIDYILSHHHYWQKMRFLSRLKLSKLHICLAPVESPSWTESLASSELLQGKLPYIY
jgi:hypothetical protein